MVVNIKEGTWYNNSKGSKRYIVQIEYDINKGRTRVLYIKNSMYEAVKSCYKEQFIRWLTK